MGVAELGGCSAEEGGVALDDPLRGGCQHSFGWGLEGREGYAGDVLVAGEGGVLDEGVVGGVGGGEGSAHGGVVVARDDDDGGAFGGDEVVGAGVSGMRDVDSDGQGEDAADAGDGAAVNAGGGGDEGERVGLGGDADDGEVAVEREVEGLRHRAEGAPGGAEDFEGRDAHAVAFFFDVDGLDAEVFGERGERDETCGRVAGELSVEGFDEVGGFAGRCDPGFGGGVEERLAAERTHFEGNNEGKLGLEEV